MAKKKRIPPTAGPGRSANAPPGAQAGAPPPKKKAKPKRTWPYALVLLFAWALIFGAIYVSHLISELPDVTNLLAKGPSREITVLDSSGHVLAQRNLDQGAM